MLCYVADCTAIKSLDTVELRQILDFGRLLSLSREVSVSELSGIEYVYLKLPYLRPHLVHDV